MGDDPAPALRRLRPDALIRLALALVLSTAVADYGLKPLVRRPRPFASDPHVVLIGGRPHGASFPSGHAANAFAGASVLSVVALEPPVVWWLLAAAIAYSRVHVGLHYPLDVLAGALVGVLCAATVMTWRTNTRGRSVLPRPAPIPCNRSRWK